MKEFDDIWRAWIDRNVVEGCSKDVLFKILHDSGFAYAAIREELRHEPAVSLDRIFSPLASLADEGSQPMAMRERDFASLLEPGSPLACPDWIREQTRAQQQRVPFLGAGGPLCRGFEKRRLERDVFQRIRARYALAAEDMREELDSSVGTYIETVNSSLPATLVHIDDDFNRALLELMKPLHEEWCGFELEASSCYGFRVYLPGCYLHMHVDRPESHVVSSTLCVDRQTYAPWPLHAEDADGSACEIETEPGELVLYESARIAHGRPVPLNGRFHVALFLHYRPARDWETWRDSPMDWWQGRRGRESAR